MRILEIKINYHWQKLLSNKFKILPIRRVFPNKILRRNNGGLKKKMISLLSQLNNMELKTENKFLRCLKIVQMYNVYTDGRKFLILTC